MLARMRAQAPEPARRIGRSTRGCRNSLRLRHGRPPAWMAKLAVSDQAGQSARARSWGLHPPPCRPAAQPGAEHQQRRRPEQPGVVPAVQPPAGEHADQHRHRRRSSPARRSGPDARATDGVALLQPAAVAQAAALDGRDQQGILIGVGHDSIPPVPARRWRTICADGLELQAWCCRCARPARPRHPHAKRSRIDLVERGEIVAGDRLPGGDGDLLAAGDGQHAAMRTAQ